MEDQDEFLTPRQIDITDDFPFTRSQLTSWRLLGVGPDYIKGPGENGRILYRRSSLQRFLSERTVSHGRAA